MLEFDRKVTGEPGQLGREIIKKRFESYNRVWLVNNNMGGADNVGTITSHMSSAGERLRSSYDEEVAMHNGAQYFDDRADPSMDWQGRPGASQYQGSRTDYYGQAAQLRGGPGSDFRTPLGQEESDEEGEDSGTYNNFGYQHK